MVARIEQQQAMIEQQRQEELLRRQHSAMQEIAQESIGEREMEMPWQMMPGSANPGYPGSNFGNNAPPGQMGVMGPSQGMQNMHPMIGVPNFGNGSGPNDNQNQMMRGPGSNSMPVPPGMGPGPVPHQIVPPPGQLPMGHPNQVGPPGVGSNPSNQMPMNPNSICPPGSAPMCPPNQMPPGTMPSQMNQGPAPIGPPGMGPQLIPPNNHGNMPPASGLGPPSSFSWNGPPGDQRNQDDSQSKGPRHQNTSNLPSLLSLKVEKPEELKKKTPDVVLPKALEEALAFKDQRAAALGSLDESSENGKFQ